MNLTGTLNEGRVVTQSTGSIGCAVNFPAWQKAGFREWVMQECSSGPFPPAIRAGASVCSYHTT